jgi:hypothetical protein
VRERAATVAETDPGQQLLRVLHSHGGFDAADDSRCEGDVVERRQVGEQVELLEHHADLHAQRTERLAVPPAHPRAQLDTRDVDLACIERLQVVEAAQERRLSAARGPDDRDRLALVDLGAHAREDVPLAVSLRELADADHATASSPVDAPAPRAES